MSGPRRPRKGDDLNILFIGDIIGKPGRRVLFELIDDIKREHEIAFTVANGENAAGGVGISPVVADELLGGGIDLLTTGNHVFRHKEIVHYLEREKRLLRPANYPPGTVGAGVWVGSGPSGHRLGIINLQGRVFLDPLDCPFRAADAALAEMGDGVKIRIIDFHAEATSEKTALGWYLDGRLSAVIGTHTHVQTADERILPKGTAYITDVGMTGPADSVIGVDSQAAISRFTTGLPHSFKPAKHNLRLCGVVVSVDGKTGKAQGITRINLGLA